MVDSLTAQDIMNPEVMSVQHDLTVAELAAFLVDQEISGAPVENELGRLVGVVSVTDIVRATSSGGERYAPDHDPGFYVRGWEDRIEPETLEGYHFDDEGLLVKDIMTPSVFAVEADTPIGEVARSMMESHLHRMLVVRDDKIVGIVSTSDMLQMVAEAC
jgi:CBS domain-containing protein